MNCLIRIRQRYAGFAQSDKKLADYLLSQPDRARHLSSQQLAGEAGVSQSSVVKFAQKIGYKGFPALKLAISEALVSNPNPQSMPVHNQIRGDDPMRLVGEKLIKENVAAMHATLDVNTEEKLLESVAMLRDARRIVLTGIGASGLVARNFGWKLTKSAITPSLNRICTRCWRPCRPWILTIYCWPSPIPASGVKLIWLPTKPCA